MGVIHTMLVLSNHAPILRGVGLNVPIFSPSIYMLTLLDAELANLTTKEKM